MIESRRMIRTENAQGLMLSIPAQKITRGTVRVVKVPGQFLVAVTFPLPVPAGAAARVPACACWITRSRLSRIWSSPTSAWSPMIMVGTPADVMPRF